MDYALIYTLAKKYHLKKYLEVGTYIGESINILVDICDKCYSLTAPLDAEYSMTRFCKKFNMPNYSDRLTHHPKIVQFHANSFTFDFDKIEKDIDLYFIDAEHTYNGVYNDTKKIFKHKKENSFVVWHDIKSSMDRERGMTLAIRDVLGSDFENFYCCDNSSCGIYIPKKFQKDFPLHEWKYEEGGALYTYDVSIEVGKS